MTKENLEKITNSMQEKLGKENSMLIADDLATLISENANDIQQNDKLNNEIKKLKEDKETLITVNGNLLQKVAMGEDDTKKKNEEEKKSDFNFASCFDDKGNFIK